MSQVFGPCYRSGILDWRPWLLASSWHNPSCFGHLWKETALHDQSSKLPPSLISQGLYHNDFPFLVSFFHDFPFFLLPSTITLPRILPLISSDVPYLTWLAPFGSMTSRLFLSQGGQIGVLSKILSSSSNLYFTCLPQYLHLWILQTS